MSGSIASSHSNVEFFTDQFGSSRPKAVIGGGQRTALLGRKATKHISTLDPMTSFLGPLRQAHLQGKAVPSKNYFRLRFGFANEWACHRFRVFLHAFGQCAQRRFDGGGCDGKGPLFVLYPGASTERGRHLLPQSHNVRLELGWWNGA